MRAHYRNNLFATPAGAAYVIPNSEVSLYDAGSSGTSSPLLETIYAGPTGGTSLTNPFTTDAYGNIEFWLATPKSVKLIASGTVDGGAYTITADYEPVLPGDPSLIVENESTDSRILKVQSGAGEKVQIFQDGFNEDEQDYGLEVVRKVRGNNADIPYGAASAIIGQVFSDGTTSGADPVAAKIYLHRTGTPGASLGAGASARALEIEAISFEQSAGTSFAAYGSELNTANPSFRGIDVGYGIDPDLPSSFANLYDGTAINLFNTGAASADGKSWASGGRQGTAAIAIWGAAGWKLPIAVMDTDAPSQSFSDVTYRVFSVDIAGANGTDGILYRTRNTTGTGMRLDARRGSGRAIDVFAVGSAPGAPHTGKLAVYDPVAGIYLMSVGVNAGDTTKGQVGILDGTLAYPGFTFFSDLDTGAYRIGTNNWALTAGGTKVIDIAAGQIGLVDGSAGAPSYSFWNDPNTGIWRQGADTLGVVTGGVEALRVDSGSYLDFRNATNHWVAASGGTTATLPGITGGAAAAAAFGWMFAKLGGTKVCWPYWLAA